MKALDRARSCVTSRRSNHGYPRALLVLVPERVPTGPIQLWNTGQPSKSASICGLVGYWMKLQAARSLAEPVALQTQPRARRAKCRQARCTTTFAEAQTATGKLIRRAYGRLNR